MNSLFHLRPCLKDCPFKSEFYCLFLQRIHHGSWYVVASEFGIYPDSLNLNSESEYRSTRQLSTFCLHKARKSNEFYRISKTKSPSNAMLTGFFFLVAHWRLELQTPWLKVKCSTDWASEPYGWGGRIRTCECGSQRPVPYPLATPQCGEHERLKKWGGIWDSNPWFLVPQTSALTSWTNPTMEFRALKL